MTKRIITFLIIILIFASIVISFASNAYTAVGGSIRSVEVFYKNRPFIHGNNHMLFPLHIYYFNKFLKLFGIESNDGFEYFKNSVILNALAAAISLGLIFLILLRLTANYSLSLIGISLIGFSYSFVLNATNPNEPMTGLFFSILSCWFSFLALEKKNAMYSIISGLTLGYAMATYQTMISILPPLLLIYLYFLVDDRERRVHLKLVSFFLLSLLAGVIIIYAACYRIFHNINNIPDFMERFFQVGINYNLDVFKAKNFLLMILWFILNTFALPYYGLKETLFGEYGNYQMWFLWSLPIILMGGLFVLVYRIFMKIIRAGRECRYISLALLSFFLFSSICPFLLWIDYSKFWLQPIAAFFILTIYIIASYLRNSSDKREKFLIVTYLLVFLIALAFLNTSRVLIPNHRGEPEVLAVIREIDNIVEKDSLVFIEWDKVSITFRTFFSGERLIFTVTTYAMTSKEKDLINEMNEKIQQAKNQGKKIYFISTGSGWNYNNVAEKSGIRSEFIQWYKDRSSVIKRFRIGEKEEYILYEYTGKKNLVAYLKPSVSPSKLSAPQFNL